ncbi:5'-nucleotidase [Alkalibacterium sp. AK22]|uniref:5'-nucleotidase C-terminal domain-containing protein n=1 Tax=Alkalibacterium sp. AK22 TaxID=1229520 RepID=UPI00045002BA|nr:5'-nucleotidase C-terminal domain-containing protein [Alkalibacterium sp. AK22]EXJ23749.1 5'-nucleotidase [Alkalibacterium sp. AK22]
MSNKGRNWVLSLLSSTVLFSAPMMAHAEGEEADNGVEDTVTAETSGDFDLTIFHTNDIHSSIDNFGKLSYFLTEQRAALENTLYLDAGDIFSGNPVVDLRQGEPLINLLNAVEVDSMVIGNHEFDYGQEAFEARRNESNFNWISANTRVVDSSIVIEQPDAYDIFEFGDKTVGVLGLTQSPPATNPAGIVGLEFGSYVDTALEYEYLRDEVDIFIALTHIGLPADRRLAEEVEFFDLIIGGHSHSLLEEPEIVNGTPVVQAGSSLRHLGILDLSIDSESGAVSVNGRVQSMNELENVDPEVQALVDQYNADADELLSEVLGVTNTGLSRDNRWSGDVALGNMITDALRTFANTEIAITNNGGIRASIAPGDITARDIFTVDPFGNDITILEMTGHELQEIIAYSYERSLDSFGAQIDLQTSGLNYIVYIDDDGRYADSDLFINGEPMDMDQTFRIATNNFIVSGGDGYDFSSATIIQEDAGQVTNALIQFVQEVTAAEGAVDYEETEGRIQVLPVSTRTPEEPVDEEEDTETDGDETNDSNEDDSTDQNDESTATGPIVDGSNDQNDSTGDELDQDEPNESESDDTAGDGIENESTLEQPESDQDDDDTASYEPSPDTQENEETADAEGERLPDTATVTWTIGLAGMGSLAAGISAYFVKKK